MPTIAPRTNIAARRNFVRLQRPLTPPAPDGDGRYTEEPWTDLDPPQQYARIEPATPQVMERISANATTVITQASHVISLPYHPQLTTDCRIVDERGRIFQVLGVSSPEDLSVDTVAQCQEVRVPNTGASAARAARPA